jgi:cell division septum initiation protein DivIVA
MDEIERALRERISQYIDGRFVSKEDVDALFAIARGDRAAVDQLKNSLTNKRNEFEQKLNQAAQQVKEEATQQTQQAVKDLLQGQTPSMPTLPSIPKLPGS